MTHKCIIPKCGPVTDRQFIVAVGEKSGRIYVCDKHRDKVSLGKAVIGAGVVAAIRTGLDTAAPGLREKIYETGTMVMGLVSHVKSSMAKDERGPAE